MCSIQRPETLIISNNHNAYTYISHIWQADIAILGYTGLSAVFLGKKKQSLPMHQAPMTCSSWMFKLTQAAILWEAGSMQTLPLNPQETHFKRLRRRNKPGASEELSRVQCVWEMSGVLRGGSPVQRLCSHRERCVLFGSNNRSEASRLSLALYVPSRQMSYVCI